jgi:hypothetical protein
MRQLLISFFILTAVVASNCSGDRSKDNSAQSAGTGTSEIVFREYEHEFGKVAEGEKISYVFTFDNKGTSDLILSSATTTCGCTVPKYETKPVPAGKSGTVEVVFNTTGRSGMQTKTITVKSNAKTPVVLLKITADVENTNNK